MTAPEDRDRTSEPAPAADREHRDGDEPTLYGLEVYNRATQEWERARWVDPRRSKVDAYDDRREQVMRGLMIYGDSRVAPVLDPTSGPHAEDTQ
ncbi:hypothetical protein [Nocardioides sp. Leaf285]|uniref:hypothetical protein n=1 Tax=Nocardioides sp. Leaf285 TaxID=1736322 RepID=UPI0007025150|nr:hypothetical protein [Nocardioides sp. Leaf285]KQP63039.1 hypothetical protein ASF47_18685 [Nocardioides sp. Leaf285]